MEYRIRILDTILRSQPLLPVIVIENIKSAVPLARALVSGGLKAMEITLRTECALEAIATICQEVEGAIVGAGTVLDGRQWDRAVGAGSKFIVSPGSTAALFAAAKVGDVPLLPGVSTASEAMRARDRGFQLLKFFPAEQSGGTAYLHALSSPLADIRFCPTGGISQLNALQYLALPNVVCIGGSWVAPKAMVANGDWEGITLLARNAMKLRRPVV